MQIPISLRNSISADLSLRRHILQPLLCARDINDAVDDGVRDMHALRREFPGYRLAQSAHGVLAGAETGHFGIRLDGCGRAGEDQGRGVGVCGDVGEEVGDAGLGEEESAFAGLLLVTHVCMVHTRLIGVFRTCAFLPSLLEAAMEGGMEGGMEGEQQQQQQRNM